MAIRTTAEDVLAILGPSYEGLDPAVLTPCILTASFIVDDVCAPIASYDAVRLELIERWLSAHVWHQLQPRAEMERVDILQTSYKSWGGVGLDNSDYGQMVKRLDTAGALAQLDEQSNSGKTKGKIGALWLGKAYTRSEVFRGP
jgi:hypothetical protein